MIPANLEFEKAVERGRLASKPEELAGLESEMFGCAT